jgi:lysophospholipase L1-like esterase
MDKKKINILQQLHQIQKKATPLVFSALLTILLIEIFLQLYYRIQNNCWLSERTASSFKIPYADKVADRRQYTLRAGFQDKVQGITIDERSFRVVPHSPSSGKIQIVNLGDSVPYGVGVRDEETYPSQLYTILRKESDETVVINAGVPSYNMRQSIDRFKLDVVKFYKSPQVVTLQAANDISLLSWYRESWNLDITWASIRFNILPKDYNIATIFYTQVVYGSLVASASPKMTTRNYEKYSSSKMVNAVKFELSNFIRFCQARNIRVILMPVDPFYYQIDNTEKNSSLPLYYKNKLYVEAWKEMINEYNNMIIEISNSNSNSVYFLDTRKIMDKEDRSKMYVDFIHYSPAGNQKIAQRLSSFMKEKHILTHN